MKVKYPIKILITALTFSVILFLCAGKTNYFQGWLFLAVNIITSLMNFWTIRNDPQLMVERSTIGKDAKSWDKVILGCSAFTYLTIIVVAGFDSGRYQWSPDFHWSIYAIGSVMAIFGNAVFLAARKENKYFSSIVRIQTDRGHTVCGDTGIYKIVRHPGYSGMAISLATLPFITGSLWGIIPTTIAILLLFIRTFLEDEALKNELPGYIGYTQKIKQRLVPKIW